MESKACIVHLNSELLSGDPDLREVVNVIVEKAAAAAAGHPVRSIEIAPDRYVLELPRKLFEEAVLGLCPGVLRKLYVAVFDCGL
jgi:hypothetical protein